MVVAATSKAKRIQMNLYGLSQKVRFVLLRFAPYGGSPLHRYYGNPQSSLDIIKMFATCWLHVCVWVCVCVESSIGQTCLPFSSLSKLIILKYSTVRPQRSYTIQVVFNIRLVYLYCQIYVNHVEFYSQGSAQKKVVQLSIPINRGTYLSI